jgi:hypothetical protein
LCCSRSFICCSACPPFQLAIVLNARLQWYGEPFGPAEIGLVLTAASIVTIAVQLTLMRSLAALAGDLPLTAMAFVLLAGGRLKEHHSPKADRTGNSSVRPGLLPNAAGRHAPHVSSGHEMGLPSTLGFLCEMVTAGLPAAPARS